MPSKKNYKKGISYLSRLPAHYSKIRISCAPRTTTWWSSSDMTTKHVNLLYTNQAQNREINFAIDMKILCMQSMIGLEIRQQSSKARKQCLSYIQQNHLSSDIRRNHYDTKKI